MLELEGFFACGLLVEPFDGYLELRRLWRC